MSGTDLSAHEVLKKFSHEERRKAIREFRRDLNLSQTEFASLAGIGPSMLSRFENGNRDLSAEAYERVENAITDALAKKKAQRGVPLASLLYPEKTKKLISSKKPISREKLISSQEEFERKTQMDPDFRVLREMTGKLLKDNQDLRAQVSELRGRVNLLSDLLGVKLKEVGAAAEAEDLQAKLER
jgi:transcriptional regulator with XRE-family HTH domain